MRIVLFLLLMVVLPKPGISQFECDRYYIFDLRDSIINSSPVVVFKIYTDTNTTNLGTYTSLCFIDQNSDTLNQHPFYSYELPIANTPYDTMEYVLYYDNGFTSFPANFDGILLMEVPDCEIPYNNTILSTPNLTIQDIGIRVFPNPFTNEIQIINETQTKLTEIKIYDSVGSLILTEDQNLNRIKMDSAKKGFYFMKFFSNEKEIGTKKIIKNKVY